MKKKYIVRLTDEERSMLSSLINKGKGTAHRIKHANILLQVDADGPNRTDEQASKAYSCAVQTVLNIRQRFVEQGFEAALERKRYKHSATRTIPDGEKEAGLIRIACSKPPEGYANVDIAIARWKIGYLRDGGFYLCTNGHADTEKNELQPHRSDYRVIPPKENAEFAACMEDVLEVYQRPYTPERPVVCFDEQPTQLIGETRQLIPMEPDQLQHYDYEYERMGTASNFMMTEPLSGWRKVNVRDTRTAVDLAKEVKELLDLDYPDVEKVILVWDNLNTHVPASLYKAFGPAEARRLLERLEIHYTPKHGSWVNIAEIELSVFTKQCLGRPIPNIEMLPGQAKAWENPRNAAQSGVNWHFTTDDARTKLK
uniref:DDE superfamily endonuclease n=1 Tax=Candidatus Kentrum eta TaxID=2126337 RepID=A0A450VSS9_9GAMM|nr:MAG: DDE superfamily endonuclease [Candidatus Kentron sp. H]VFK07841.1 MAG: DDE superfamily endonuclease [Candidatus Kentron sp. H]